MNRSKLSSDIFGSILLSLVLLISPREVEAQVDSHAADAELAHVEWLVKQYNSGFHDYRLWGSISLLAAGAITLPAVIVSRHHAQVGESAMAAVTVGLGAGELAGGLVLALGFSDAAHAFTDLSASIDEQRAAHKQSAEILASLDAECKAMSDSARSMRRLMGIIGTSIGVLSLGGGTILALSNVKGLSKTERLDDSAALLGLGGVALIYGLRLFLIEDVIEVAWKTRQAMTGRSTSMPALEHIVCTPLRGGGAVGLRVTF